MSKILKALEKAKKWNNNSGRIDLETDAITYERNGNQDHILFKNRMANIAVVIVLCSIGLSSIFISFKTLAELKRARKVSAVLAQNISQHKKEIGKISTFVNEANLRKSKEGERLAAEITHLESAIKERDADVAELSVDFNILKVSIKELETDNQRLMEKIITVDSSIDQLKNLKEKILEKYVVLNRDFKKFQRQNTSNLEAQF